jgi:hypothetical protein
MDHTEWHKDQDFARKDAIFKKVAKKAEFNQILNGYSWVKVPRYYEVDPNKEDVDWNAEYQKLMEHHKEETEFLIDKIREIIKTSDEYNKI